MANECPVWLELKTTNQLGKLHAKKYPQPFLSICPGGYLTLKSKTSLVFANCCIQYADRMFTSHISFRKFNDYNI